MSKINAAFIGLGTMGYPMAGHLAEAGLSMTVYNRTASRANQWARDFSGRIAATPAEAAAGAAMVFVCVGNDDDLRQVTLGPDGVLETLSERALLVDHTTAWAETQFPGLFDGYHFGNHCTPDFFFFFRFCNSVVHPPPPLRVLTPFF